MASDDSFSQFDDLIIGFSRAIGGVEVGDVGQDAPGSAYECLTQRDEHGQTAWWHVEVYVLTSACVRVLPAHVLGARQVSMTFWSTIQVSLKATCSSRGNRSSILCYWCGMSRKDLARKALRALYRGCSTPLPMRATGK